MKVKIILAVALAALLVFPTGAFAATWDLATDYAARGDSTLPPGAKDSSGRSVWYFKYASNGNATNPASFASGDLQWVPSWNWMMNDPADLKGWWRGSPWAHISVNTGAGRNSNTTPGFFWGTGVVLAHPMPYSDLQPYVVVEWKSPVAGDADADVVLTDLDGGGGDGFEYWVLNGSTELAHGTVANGAPATTVPVAPVTVATGESIYLVLGPGVAGDHGWDSTRLEFAVTVPDPPVVSTPASSGWTVAAMGLLGLAVVVRSRRLLALN